MVTESDCLLDAWYNKLLLTRLIYHTKKASFYGLKWFLRKKEMAKYICVICGYIYDEEEGCERRWHRARNQVGRCTRRLVLSVAEQQKGDFELT